MNGVDQLNQPPGEPPLTVDLLQQLCDRQRAEIERLRRERDAADDQTRRVALEALEASRERQLTLAKIQAEVAGLRALNDGVVKQRDIVVRGLRYLVAAAPMDPTKPITDAQLATFAAAHRQALELLRVIDQAEAAAKARREAEQPPAPKGG